MESAPKDFIDYTLAVFDERQPFRGKPVPLRTFPLDLHEEVHIPADLLSVRYRQKLKALGLGEQFTA